MKKRKTISEDHAGELAALICLNSIRNGECSPSNMVKLIREHDIKIRKQAYEDAAILVYNGTWIYEIKRPNQLAEDIRNLLYKESKK